MSDFLSSLNNPGAAKEAESWEAEVAKAEAEIKPPTEEKPSAEPTVSRETKPEASQTEQKPVVEQPAAVQPEQKEDKQVPLKALHEEREARKALERKLAELEQRFTQPPVQEEAPPDPEVDPIGALKYQMAQAAALQQQQQAQTYHQALLTGFQTSMRGYMETEPAFMDAYQYALKSRANELRVLGTPEEEIDSTLKLEQLQIADTARKQGKNPAEIIYKFAEARGFQKKAPETKPAQAATPVVDPVVAQAKADAAVSLGNGGKPPANELTEEEALRTLKGAALDSWIDKRWKAMEQAGGRKSSLFPN